MTGINQSSLFGFARDRELWRGRVEHFMHHHCLITGTGRAGTTFLVKLLMRLGLDTGFSPDQAISPIGRAGLEHRRLLPTSPYLLEGVIDTTFALHRAGEPFRRKKSALRVYEPFEALHLDWYPGENKENTYSESSSPAISHWANAEVLERNKDGALKYSEFNAVRVDSSGALGIYKQRL